MFCDVNTSTAPTSKRFVDTSVHEALWPLDWNHRQKDSSNHIETGEANSPIQHHSDFANHVYTPFPQTGEAPLDCLTTHM